VGCRQGGERRSRLGGRGRSAGAGGLGRRVGHGEKGEESKIRGLKKRIGGDGVRAWEMRRTQRENNNARRKSRGKGYCYWLLWWEARRGEGRSPLLFHRRGEVGKEGFERGGEK